MQKFEEGYDPDYDTTEDEKELLEKLARKGEIENVAEFSDIAGEGESEEAQGNTETSEQMKALLNEAMYELMHYPRIRVRTRIKNALKFLLGRGFTYYDSLTWPTGLLAQGLMDYYQHNRETREAQEVLEALKRYYDRFIRKGCKLHYLDDAAAGCALIDLHQITGEEKYKEAADKILAFLFDQETDQAGSFLYRPEQKNDYVFADAVGMTSPFLCKYGATYHNSDALTLGGTQLLSFVQMSMDEKTGLPYHGYQYESGLKYGIIGWGRAVGWLMIGFSESLNYIDSSSAEFEPIKQAYRRLVDKVEAYQLEGGLYTWQLSAKEGPVDTSATAMICLAIARSLEKKQLIGIHKSRMLRGRDALWNFAQDGKVPGAMAECIDFSQYPQIYGACPWSLGPAISLFAIAENID